MHMLIQLQAGKSSLDHISTVSGGAFVMCTWGALTAEAGPHMTPDSGDAILMVITVTVRGSGKNKHGESKVSEADVSCKPEV